MMKKIGRPTKITDLALKKLDEVFAMGGTDEEACFYADISHQTLYDYQKRNQAFIERKNALKQRPILMARKEVIKGLGGNPEFCLKFLERKKRDEFGLHAQIINQINQGQNINNVPSEKIQELGEEYEEKLKAELYKNN